MLIQWFSFKMHSPVFDCLPRAMRSPVGGKAENQKDSD